MCLILQEISGLCSQCQKQVLLIKVFLRTMSHFKKHPGDYVVKFKIADVFPTGDHLSSDLLRLMTAVEDLSNIERLKAMLDEDPDMDDNISVTKWKKGHFFLLRLRLGFLCNVLDEVLFKKYKKSDRPGLQQLISAMDQKVKDAYGELKGTINRCRRGKEIINKFRNWASFHYGDSHFKKALETVAPEIGEIIINPDQDDVHFIVAYQVLDHAPVGIVSREEVVTVRDEFDRIQRKLHEFTIALFDEYVQTRSLQEKITRE